MLSSPVYYFIVPESHVSRFAIWVSTLSREQDANLVYHVETDVLIEIIALEIGSETEANTINNEHEMNLKHAVRYWSGCPFHERMNVHASRHNLHDRSMYEEIKHHQYSVWGIQFSPLTLLDDVYLEVGRAFSNYQALPFVSQLLKIRLQY